MSGLLATVRGQPAAVRTLQRALVAGRISHAYLFDGPDGVGKERAAWGLAQALLCHVREAGQAEACGVCSGCMRAVPRAGEKTARHPDAVVLERGLYEPAAIGRSAPEIQDLSVDQVRTLVLSRAAFGPLEGRARIFIVRGAEHLSLTAANALLKTLEEPPSRTHFVLLSAAADTLLATVRSRAQRLRFGPLPDELVAELLSARGVEPAQAALIAPLAGGSIAQAITLSEPEASAERTQFVSSALAALSAPHLGPALDLAENAKRVERHLLREHLQALALAVGAQGLASVADAGRAADVASARYSLVLGAVQEIDANVSLQLAVESMLVRMRAA